MKSVLVVEDTEDIRDLLVGALEREGYQVLPAEHGQEALDVLEHADPKPCLVLLDWLMPIMDGETFLRELRESDQWSSVPVVVVSAVSGMTEVHGADRVLTKPLGLGALRGIIQDFCGPP